MESKSRVLEYAVWAVLGVVVLGIAGAFAWTRMTRPPSLPVYGQVPDFTLTNQVGKQISLRNLRGTVWLADLVFTRCAGPCPKLSGVMADLHRSLQSYSSLRFVTLTTDPAYDTRPVLLEYAQQFQADPQRWWFLTGPKRDLHHLAMEGLKLAVVEKEEAERTAPEDLFIHSTLIALIDEQGRMRAFFEALEPGAPEKIAAAVKELMRNP